MSKKGRKLIERLVMGKPREKDFTEADLPSNRPKQFRFVFKTRFGVIFRGNLLAALFAIPYIVWEILADAYVSNFVVDLTAAEHASNLVYLTLLQYGTEIPLLMLAFVGLSGIYYLVRRGCWGQPVKVISDFFKGLKQSWVQFLFLGLLTGVINLLIRYAVKLALLTMAGGDALVWGLALTAIALFAVLYCVVLMFAMCQSSLYKLSFGRLLYNSVILTFKRLFRSILMCFCSFAPIFVFIFMPWMFVRIIGYCLAVVFSVGFAATLQTVYSHWVFDELINAKSYPDFVGVGLAGGNFPEDLMDEPRDETLEEQSAEDMESVELPAEDRANSDASEEK